MKLFDNTLLISGGPSGMSYSMAKAFLKAGSRVIRSENCYKPK